MGIELAICSMCKDEVPKTELTDIGKHNYSICKTCKRFYTPPKK